MTASGRDASPTGSAPLPPEEQADAEDLRPADLDAMSPATWRACMAWLLTGLGYELERVLDDKPGTAGAPAMPAFVCRRAQGQAASPASAGVLAGLSAPLIVAVGYRPRDPALLHEDAVARARQLAARVGGATPLLLTTAHGAPERRSQAARSGQMPIVTRAALARLLANRTAAYHQERAMAADAMDARANQAMAVRAALVRACLEATTHLTRGVAATRTVPDHAAAAHTTQLMDGARVVRQSLTALETLAEEWEGLSSATPSRDGTLAITASSERLEDLLHRAEHLTAVLVREVAALGAMPALGDRPGGALRDAVVEELRLRCEALAARCEALNPELWRSFAAAHNQEAAERSVRAAGSSRRAAIRAARILAELEAQSTFVTRGRRPPAGQEA